MGLLPANSDSTEKALVFNINGKQSLSTKVSRPRSVEPSFHADLIQYCPQTLFYTPSQFSSPPYGQASDKGALSQLS